MTPSAPPPARPSALLDAWFASRSWTPFPFQREVWDHYARGGSGLVHAATGTGKTYAAWLAPVLQWLEEYPDAPRPRARERQAPLRVLWITPLRALAADTEQALRTPVEALGLPWSVESRTGDTKASLRARQRERLPTALVTTPESLSLLLCRADHPELFAHLECVVVDEWHELMASKRGVQVELALARLRRLRPNLRTWGLSATLGNLDEARETLLGRAPDGSPNPGLLVRGLVPKQLEIAALIPDEMERFPWAGHLNTRLLPAVLGQLAEARSAIVFTNTRSQCELWYQSILTARPDWFEHVALHHGSIAPKRRLDAEDGLRTGRYRCVVATSSLDLGVDFAPVDLVLQVGSPKGCARLLQRAGRSGHAPGRGSRILCIPTHAFELVEVAAARDAIEAGAMEARSPLDRPLDLLAQHLVTLALGGGFTRDEALAELRATRAYGRLEERELDWVLDFVTRGGDALRAYPEYQKVREVDGRFVVTDRQVALRHRLNIGTIVSDASIAVRYLSGGSLGTVEEGFVARLKAGDRFIFAGKPLEFVRVRDMTAWVRKAKSVQGAVPRWAGARMPLSSELSLAVRAKLEEARTGRFLGAEMEAVRPILALQAERSRIPAPDELLIERCETKEGHHLWFFPFEGRLVHEGLGALLAYRLAQHAPLTFTFACNDYGVELLSADPAPLEAALAAGLLGTDHLLHDIAQALNAAELARRQFREIARVAGLVFQGYPGQAKSMRQVQASSGLLYDVFSRYDPDNLLLHQAQREVLERQLEASRLGATLARLARGRITIVDTDRPTPLAFPILVDRTRDRISSEKLADRVRRMTVALERPGNPAALARVQR
ncbi:MAG: ligase-associated DNA damage response DEXH box helicase [Gemmatimonadales bacterium]|nr:ligase-associated DNA damage response DEXH box helicase [Gemmatimonadales bacterium]